MPNAFLRKITIHIWYSTETELFPVMTSSRSDRQAVFFPLKQPNQQPEQLKLSMSGDNARMMVGNAQIMGFSGSFWT
jgi:hypothetical protein